MSSAARALAAALLLAGLLTGCAAGGGGSVSVLGPWTDPAEKAGFLAMLKGFEKRTGIRVDYNGTRDSDAVLASELQNGAPPDAAVLATPGELRQYAAQGRLQPLDGDMDPLQYAQSVRDLTVAAGPGGARHSYAIIVKAALKSVVWYDPRTLPRADLANLTAPGLTWQGLSGIAAGLGTGAWCLGLQDVSSSGWPGTDWIEDLVLHEAGPSVYDAWVDGRVKWTSPPITRAWQDFGTVVAHGGGGGPALLTGFGQAGTAMFRDPPRCRLDHEGSFITGAYEQAPGHPVPGRDFAFVPFPGRGTAEIAGDLLGVFRSAGPAARRLAAYLTTPEAQAAWARLPKGGAISLNRQVSPGVYPDVVSREVAAELGRAGTVRFDASDSMPHVMSAAFDDAVLEYAADPARLGDVLQALDKIQEAAYR